MLTIDPKHYLRWFGAIPEEETANRVFRILEDQLNRQFGSTLQPTPGRTGLLAWRRLQEQRRGEVGGDWPTLPPDLQTIIRETTGQGRFECCCKPMDWVHYPKEDRLEWTIPNLYALDMQFAYAAGALALHSAREWRHEMWTEGGPVNPSGPPIGFLGHTPAWYRVRFEAPRGWKHVGILPFLYTDGWSWPTDWLPRETWAGYQEVGLAIECGWQVEILESIYALKTGNSHQKPLDLWARKLIEMQENINRRHSKNNPAPEISLWQAAIRNVLLHAIGSFARNPRTGRRTALEGEAIPDHQLARETARPILRHSTPPGQRPGYECSMSEIVGWEYDDYLADAGAERYQHPEWSALIWADCRTRLLRNKHFVGGQKVEVGALSLPREQIVGFAQDCIYVTEDPKWPLADTGKGFRVKHHVPGPLPAPRTMADIYRLTGEGQ